MVLCCRCISHTGDETSWPDLSQPGQFVASQQPVVSTSNKLDMKRPEANGARGATPERPDSYSAGVQRHVVTSASQTSVSRGPATSQLPAEKKSQTGAIPTTTIVSQKTNKSKKCEYLSCEIK